MTDTSEKPRFTYVWTDHWDRMASSIMVEGLEGTDNQFVRADELFKFLWNERVQMKQQIEQLTKRITVLEKENVFNLTVDQREMQVHLHDVVTMLWDERTRLDQLELRAPRLWREELAELFVRDSLSIFAPSNARLPPANTVPLAVVPKAFALATSTSPLLMIVRPE